jgi:hypothetical protein
MATQGAQIRETFIAGASFYNATVASNKQFYFVTLAADGKVDPTGNGLAADGVILNDPILDEAATVVVFGRVTVECGGTVTAGGIVASDADGRCVDAASTDIILGKALEAGIADQIITIDFFKGGNAAA